MMMLEEVGERRRLDLTGAVDQQGTALDGAVLPESPVFLTPLPVRLL